ncbi:MAG: hypothetical protein HY040_18140 [Planctomycetes bacterium]|nr:hypothetical protein [Planctomycetota bacterium]
MPYIGSNREADESLSKQGIIVASEAIFRCPTEVSLGQSAPDGDGVWHRTSYLLYPF